MAPPNLNLNGCGTTKTIRIGSRDSELAKVQSNEVIARLKQDESLTEKYDFELVTMKTIGDKILDKALAKTGEKNLFTRELETALKEGDIDMIVHSLKDLTTTLEDGFEIGAILKRSSPYDAVVLKKSIAIAQQFKDLKDLPSGSKVGTSSLRRIAQLRRTYPHLVFESIRGNLNTRLRKLDEGENFQAIILAEAGLKRLNWDHRISFVLDPEKHSCLYAVGQGALAVEIRQNDQEMLHVLKTLNDESTILTCLAERSFLKQLDGGCSTPVGVTTSLSMDSSDDVTDEKKQRIKLSMHGRVLSLDGAEQIEANRSIEFGHVSHQNGHNDFGHGDVKRRRVDEDFTGINESIVRNRHLMEEASFLGRLLAQRLIDQGAKKLLDSCKQIIHKEMENDLKVPNIRNKFISS